MIYEELINIDYLKSLLNKIKLEKFDNINLKYFTNSNKKDLDLKSALSNYNKAMNLYNDYKNTFL